MANRADELIGEVLKRIHDVIHEHDVTYEEYGVMKQWLIDVGEAGEWPLFLDVFVESAVEEQVFRDRDGSQGTILGPYHLPDAPVLDAPYELPRREDEKGDRVVFSGRVTDDAGAPVAGAELDIWHADADGYYSGFEPGCRRASSAARSSPTRTAATRSARSSRRPTRSRSTARPAPCARRRAGARGARPTST